MSPQTGREIHARREAGASALDAARDGASEVGQAVVASTLTTVAVFLPIVFVEGIAGQLFRDQALTVSVSLIASLIVAVTLIPMLSAAGSLQWYRDTLAPEEDFGKLVEEAAAVPAGSEGLLASQIRM